eukprot:jgi/Undpi1/11308/HiC_scaffold_30.g13606.m1
MAHPREVLLPPGTRTMGRSSETGIKSQFVSRKHIELIVEDNTCKVRYCAKHMSEVKIDASPVNKEWVECPVGARLELLANPSESFPYRLEQYSTKTSARKQEQTNSSVGLLDNHQEMATRLNCPMCFDLYVEPTELDCEGKHLFCHKCIYGVLSSEGCTNKCPVCNTKISHKRRTTILKTSNKRGRKDPDVGSSKKYQSQAVRLVQDMIEWMINRRMCEYGDESEWRKRSGLQPLPPQKQTAQAAAPAANNKKGRPQAEAQAPIPIGNAGGGGGGGGDIFGGTSSEVIDLLSDSDEGI